MLMADFLRTESYHMPKLFEKGKSGNPGGRPKAAYDIKALAQANTKEAFEVILRIMRDEENPELALKAANIVIERGYGKPIQEMKGIFDHNVTHMPSIQKQYPGEADSTPINRIVEFDIGTPIDPPTIS